MNLQQQEQQQLPQIKLLPSLHVGATPTHQPFPSNSLQIIHIGNWSVRVKNDEQIQEVENVRTYYAIIWKFLNMCRNLYDGLVLATKGLKGGFCKLTLMPGLLISWKNSNNRHTILAFSFFTRDNKMPPRWMIPTKGGKFRSIILQDPLTTVLRPRIYPILNLRSQRWRNIRTLWYSPDNHMAVAYTTFNNIFHILLEPMWIISSKNEVNRRIIPPLASNNLINMTNVIVKVPRTKTTHKKPDNDNDDDNDTTEEDLEYGLGERYRVLIRPLQDGISAWAIFHRRTLSPHPNLPPSPPLLPLSTVSFMSSLMWGVHLLSLSLQKKEVK